MALHFLKNIRKFISNDTETDCRKFQFENFIAHPLPSWCAIKFSNWPGSAGSRITGGPGLITSTTGNRLPLVNELVSLSDVYAHYELSPFQTHFLKTFALTVHLMEVNCTTSWFLGWVQTFWKRTGTSTSSRSDDHLRQGRRRDGRGLHGRGHWENQVKRTRRNTSRFTPRCRDKSPRNHWDVADKES